MQQFFKMRGLYRDKICGISPRKTHKEYLKLSRNIKAIESDSLCRKICDIKHFRQICDICR